MKPKLKIMKNKENKPMYMKTISNPFKKPIVREYDYSSKHSGMSPNSRLKTSEIYKEKKPRKKSTHKRTASHSNGIKSQSNLGRSQTSLTDESKCIKVTLLIS